MYVYPSVSRCTKGHAVQVDNNVQRPDGGGYCVICFGEWARATFPAERDPVATKELQDRTRGFGPAEV